MSGAASLMRYGDRRAPARNGRRAQLFTTSGGGTLRRLSERRSHSAAPCGRSSQMVDRLMHRVRRAALAALVTAIAIGGPASLAFGQAFDDPAPAYPWAHEAPRDDAFTHHADVRYPAGVAGRIAEWAAVTDDNGALPFLIVDKLGARIFAFDSTGHFLGAAPALVGLAHGDDSAPGIGRLKLSQISAAERTTPAGRFVAAFGPSSGHGTVLWVDAHDGIALHPVMSVNAGERRFERIKSTDPEQHRISYGCINVPKTFYDSVVTPALRGGDAVVYVLPDTKPVEEVFPAFAAASSERHHRPLRQEVSRVELASH